MESLEINPDYPTFRRQTLWWSPQANLHYKARRHSGLLAQTGVNYVFWIKDKRGSILGWYTGVSHSIDGGLERLNQHLRHLSQGSDTKKKQRVYDKAMHSYPLGSDPSICFTAAIAAVCDNDPVSLNITELNSYNNLTANFGSDKVLNNNRPGLIAPVAIPEHITADICYLYVCKHQSLRLLAERYCLTETKIRNILQTNHIPIKPPRRTKPRRTKETKKTTAAEKARSRNLARNLATAMNRKEEFAEAARRLNQSRKPQR